MSDGDAWLVEGSGVVALRLDAELRLAAFTPAAGEQLGLKAMTLGVALGELEARGLLYRGVTAEAQAVLHGVASSSGQVTLEGGRTALARVTRYDDDVIIHLVDVSALVRRQDLLARALREIEDYKTALDRSSIVSMTDREGRITHVNELFCRISGYRREELIGKNHRIVNSGFHSRAFIKDMWDTILLGRVWNGELRNKAKEGSYHWVDTTIVPFLDEDRRPIRFLAIRSDISQRVVAREQLARSESRFRALFANAPVGIAITDVQGLISDANATFARLLDRSVEELRGRPLTEFVARGAGDDGRGDREVLAGRRESHAIERKMQRADGSVAWIKVTTWMIPAHAGEPHFLINMIEDTSREHQAAEQLRAQASLARLGEMATVVAHEVKNPLAGIGGALSVIRDRMAADSMEREIIDEIQDRLGRLDKLVDGLSRFARPLRLFPSDVPMRELLARVAGQLPQQLEGAEVRVELFGVDANVRGDPSLLDELFTNILKNAANAMQPDGGTVHIDIAAVEGGCTVTVRDHGFGIAPENRARVFDPFFTTHHQGIGLGLAQARRIARAHGGDVTLVDTDQSGTVFCVAMPCRSPRTRQARIIQSVE
ncbi:MAG: PAS domain S-box protein [Nannocystaceae bacterium]